ncbi:MAG: choice-of-anchor D domain-containing protein [Bryobacterales bacterium]|nr:choice-of-anchor D domain-containing protein [Bryobacterales bacterium]
MKALVWLLLSLPAAAQLQVLTLQSGSLAAVGPSVNLGSAAVGDALEVRVRALNTGTAPIPLSTITVNGAAFSLAAAFLPLTLAPSQSHDFAVRFAPSSSGSYSASLTVNTFSTLLRATAVPGPSLSLTNGNQTVELNATSLQVNLALGQTLTIALSAGNPHGTPLELTELSLTGEGFSLVNRPAFPVTLAPGESVAIPVRVTGVAEGESSATLAVGPRRFTIFAIVFRPQLAAPRIITGDGPRNGQQLTVRLQLAQAAIGAGSGLLRAIFAGAVDDPAIMFPNGAREIKFDVAAGSRDATFNGAAETVLQTGTTAGTLRLEAVTETGVTSETFRFERGLVVVDNATARRNGSNLEIDINGYDNTREVGSLNFRFFDRAGNAIGGVITTTPADLFKAYFAQSNLGGVFGLRAVFPVTGDATIVGSVLVEIANPVGRTDLPRLLFP